VIANRLESVPARIGRWAVRTPDQVAVVDPSGARLTYAELDRRSNLFASRLQTLGATADACIALYLDRSLDFVVAALAVLKSGAAYLPLDASTPRNRVEGILRDAGAIALVTDSQTLSRAPTGPWQVLRVDEQGGEETLSFSAADVDPGSLAYVMYTSGSTGKPKGVEISHASLCNLVDWHQAAFEVSSHDRAAQIASFGFDAAVWEIWPHLAAGAALHIADDVTRRSAEWTRDWMLAQNITIAFVPTALAEQLFHARWPADTSLRLLLTGGDTLRRRPPPGLPFVVVNNYGPTECTVVATSGIVSPDSDELPSIGTPILNASVLIVDDALRPVAAGQPGELCIAGPLVARGYRNQPELSAKQFIACTNASGEQLRMYRTGDRVRLLESGELVFLGRLDDQVKIRGYRIELGEVEACLCRADGVQAAVAATRLVGDAGLTLVAYVVLRSGAQLSAAKLREFLSAELPAYMVPAFFVSIPSLPVTPNGKVDRAALPAPDSNNLLQGGDLPAGPRANGSPADSEASAPPDGFQAQISAMIASMLGLQSIGPNDNFFMIGGHSMLGMELVARIRETFGVRLTLRQLFTAPTVAALSAEVAQLASGPVRT
jgi:amino acid adenylation domain-containing protein